MLFSVGMQETDGRLKCTGAHGASVRFGLQSIKREPGLSKKKEQRWHEVKGETLYIYDHPHPEQSQSVSVTRLSDMAYYRNTFHLRKTGHW